MGELSREQLEKMADVLSSLLLEFVDAQTAESCSGQMDLRMRN